MYMVMVFFLFTLSPDQKGIETSEPVQVGLGGRFTLSPDQKGIETYLGTEASSFRVHTEPRSKGD